MFSGSGSGETGGGIANALVGSFLVVIVASLMALPIGIGAAIFVNEFPSQGFGRTVRFLAEVLTGVPSIVVGLFAYALVVIPSGGFSALSGSVAYAFIMIPIILISAHEALRLVPDSLREASLALGIPKWRTVMTVSLKTASPGIITGCMLAFARVAGETAPLLFTAFGNQFWPTSLNEPIAALPLQIFVYAVSPYDEWHRLAWAGALVLIVLIMVSVTLVRVVTGRGMLKGGH